MLSAFQKELMTKLKPKVENAGDKDDVATDKETEEKELKNEEEEKSSPQSEATPDPSATEKKSENEGPCEKGDEDQLFNFDALVTNSRLSSQAARHKLGVVRNAKQKRQRPARARSYDGVVLNKVDVTDFEMSLDDASPTVHNTDHNKTEEESSHTTPAADSPTIETIKQEKQGTSKQVEKHADDEPKPVPNSDVDAGCPNKSNTPIQNPSEPVASRIFASAKTAISEDRPGSPTRPSKLDVASSRQSKSSENPSPDANKSPVSPLSNKSPVTSHATSPGNKKSPTSPGIVTVSLASKNQADAPSDASPEGYSMTRRRSSIRDLARRFELDGSEDSKKSPESKSSQGNSSAPEESSKRLGDSGSNKAHSSPSGKSAAITTSPRKLSQPSFSSSTANKTPPLRKASEPAIKKPIGSSSSTIATRISKLTEKPAVTEKTLEVSRPRASTTSSINERANVFREGPKSTTEVRKLSVNSGERRRTKVMDMMKKFET